MRRVMHVLRLRDRDDDGRDVDRDVRDDGDAGFATRLARDGGFGGAQLSDAFVEFVPKDDEGTPILCPCLPQAPSHVGPSRAPPFTPS